MAMAQNDDAGRAKTVMTIAQLKFKQALKKEDVEAHLSPVSIDASTQFFTHIDAVLAQNTAVNVQKCTEWIVKHIAPSKARIKVLGDYLVSVSRSIAVDHNPATAAAKKAARNRFDVLLVVSDVLHTDKYHQRSTEKSGIFSSASMSYMPELVELTASCAFDKHSPLEAKLRAMLNYWAINHVISAEDFKLLQDRADESLMVAQGGIPVRKRNYLLPDYHGDRSAPWYDLPAAYMLDPMIKHRHRPIDPYRIKVAKLDRKPVSLHVRKLLDDYFENIDLKHVPTGDNPSGETKKYKLWLDPMGQLVKQDKETGDTAIVCNGYGWSPKLCQDMREHGVPTTIRKAREDVLHTEEARNTGGTDRKEESRDMPQKRRPERRNSPSPGRQSPSHSDYGRRRGRASRSRSHSRSRSRRRSSSSYDSRDGHDQRLDNKDYEQTRRPQQPYNRNVPQSGPQRNDFNDPSRNINHGSPTANQYPPLPSQNFNQAFPPLAQPPFNAQAFVPPPMMPGQLPGQFPIHNFPPPPPLSFQGPGSFPAGVPPPPPPNFSGPFPPPPPNMAAMPNLPYNFNNQMSNAYGNNFGFGNNASYSQNQGGYQGGGPNQGSTQNQGGFQSGNSGHGGFQTARGGFRGNYQSGGNYKSRGNHGVSQRGQRGGRWN